MMPAYLKAAMVLIVIGSFLIMDIRLPSLNWKQKMMNFIMKLEEIAEPKDQRQETAAQWVARINGRSKEPFAVRSLREARYTYEVTGQSDRFRHTLLMALLAGALGAGIGLILRNILLAIVLAAGFYFLPLWMSRFSLYRYESFVSTELETTLSLITTSYLRCNDILTAVDENIKYMKDPVKVVFTSFSNNLKYVDANAPAQIERMKNSLDNKIFQEWCDVLIACQDNHLIQDNLRPIVAKFSATKQQEEENKTRMMQPLRRAGTMAGIVAMFPVLLLIFNRVWYDNLMHTLPGQVVLAGAAITVFMTIDKAIRLSEPVVYDV